MARTFTFKIDPNAKTFEQRVAERRAAMTPEQRAAEDREDAARMEREAYRQSQKAAQAARNAAYEQAQARAAAGFATERQIAYIRDLGVNLSNEYADRLTKNDASAIIDAVKSGNGVGMYGLFFNDGSN